MDALDEAAETYRDVLRQVAVHDHTPGMAEAAEVLLAGASPSALNDLLAGAFQSPYGDRLLDALTRVVLLKPEGAQ